jgi:hypothetical protein
MDKENYLIMTKILKNEGKTLLDCKEETVSNFLEFIGFKLTFQSSKICYQKYIVINKSQYRITISPKTYNECDISIWNITKNSPFEHTEKIIFEDGKSRVIPICNKIMQGFEDLEEDLTELKLKYK